MTKALVSPLLYYRSLSKEYPLHHNRTHPIKFSSKFKKLHVGDYSIVLKSNKNRVLCYLRVAFLAYELHLYLHILIYMFYPRILFFGINQVRPQFLNWTQIRNYTTNHIKNKIKTLPFYNQTSLFTHVSIDQGNLNPDIEASMYLLYW